MSKPIRYCRVQKCELRCFGHGLCQFHYKRWRKYGDPTVTFTCAACSKPFEKRFSGGAKYCSEACRKLVHPIQTKVCEVCGQTIFRLRQYTVEMWERKTTCSYKCMAVTKRRVIEKPCAQCRKLIRGNPSRFNHGRGTQAFCSNACQGEFYRSKPNEAMQRTSPRNLKGIDRAIYGLSCAICGFDRFIEYAHIVPRAVGGTIHPVNILALCPNHHRLFDKNLLNEIERAAITDRTVAAFNSALARFPDTMFVQKGHE